MNRYFNILKIDAPEIKWYAKPQIPFTKILIIEKESDESFQLNHYSKEGEWAGDTWHPNFEEAKGQATFQYGNDLGEWIEIPAEVKDPVEYVLKKLK